MRIVIDIEANGLKNPDKIWVIVCKDIDTGAIRIFRNVTEDTKSLGEFLQYAEKVTLWVGHNWLEYDYPVLHRLCGLVIPNVHTVSCDTLILSRLINYTRPGGHSIEQYGEEFGIPKGRYDGPEFFKQWSQELEDYCVRDVEICRRIFLRYARIVNDVSWQPSIRLEHRFQLVVNDIQSNGFALDVNRGNELLSTVVHELKELDEQIHSAFPPREVLVRAFTPKATKYGTISKTSVPRSLHGNIHEYEIGKEYKQTKLVEFNPSSHKQLIEVLTEAGWKPEHKTQTHIDTKREYDRLKYSRAPDKQVKLKELEEKLAKLAYSGYKINEDNLATLPPSAPLAARLLAKRILLEARRRTLVEWLGSVDDDGRVRAKHIAIGTWTHRMATREPNVQNIPREFKEDGSVKYLGKELRELWIAPKDRLLVGVDAEGIQLRIFAHYIDDPEFTDALVRGKKDDKTDPHSLNARVLGSVCKSRQAAKRFIYALLLGAGIDKLAQVLDASTSETKQALDNLLQRYTGFGHLKQDVIPKDAERGWFLGLDGRKVIIPGETLGERKHLTMSGYLQNGEAIVIRKAACIIDDQLKSERDFRDWFFVDIVHDELQSEVCGDRAFAERIAESKAQAIKQAGEELKLKCPMAGSWQEGDRVTIGNNWYQTH